MKRKFLFSLYETPQGKLLQRLEKSYLKRSITVSCKQTILQIGALNWEDQFIDCSLYQYFSVLDLSAGGSQQSNRICGMSSLLPIQSESVDLVILPHLLEFDASRFTTLREVDRILKPGGELIILNFNPMSVWVRLHCLWNKKLSDTWLGHFIQRARVADWLKLLNFEILSTTEFTIDSSYTTPDRFKFGKCTCFSMAYAVKAVKRQYTLIPLTPVKAKTSKLFTASSSGLKSTIHRTDDHE